MQKFSLRGKFIQYFFIYTYGLLLHSKIIFLRVCFQNYDYFMQIVYNWALFVLFVSTLRGKKVGITLDVLLQIKTNLILTIDIGGGHIFRTNYSVNSPFKARKNNWPKKRRVCSLRLHPMYPKRVQNRRISSDQDHRPWHYCKKPDGKYLHADITYDTLYVFSLMNIPTICT